MLARLKTEFERYFLFDATSRARGGFVGNLFSYGTNRNVVSEIIKDRVYLSNLPRNTSKATLVVSAIDIPELAESLVLLEPQLPSEQSSEKIKYHLLAMQDATAVVGSIDHIYDTLQIMSEHADHQKPIQIHCYSGVGRSAMITAIHIAHRYLLGDEVVKACINKQAALDPTSEKFIPDLYDTVSKYVFSQRTCCQFDSAGRNKLAVTALTELHQRIKANLPMKEARDDSYQFLATFVQTPEYKKLHHYFYNGLTQQAFYTPYVKALSSVVTQSQQVAIDPQKIIKQFFDDLLSNRDGWYQQLVEAVHSEEISVNEKNPLLQLCDRSSEAAEEKHSAAASSSSAAPNRRQFLKGILEAVDRVATAYPHAIHSQQTITYREKLAATQTPSSPRNALI